MKSIQTFQPFSTGHIQIDRQLGTQTLKRTRTDPSSASTPYPNPSGLSRRQHLQIEGPPGSGKTKLVIGIAIRARAASLVRSGGEQEVEVLLVDSDGSLHPSLVRRSALALVHSVYKDNNESNLIDRICDGCHLVRITSTPELGFFFRNLHAWLRSHPKVKLVILDSITAHTRYVSMSINHRRTITKILRDAIITASTIHDCAVVVTTQLTTKSQMNQGAYMNNTKFLVAPEFKPSLWSKEDSSSSSSPATRSSVSKLWKICLIFNNDGTRKAIVSENEKIVPPKSGVLIGIDDVGIYDPTLPSANPT